MRAKKQVIKSVTLLLVPKEKMAHRKDDSSLVPRVSMSAFRERTHLQKRLEKYDREEEKELRKLQHRQDVVMKDLKGSLGAMQQREKDLLAKQKQLMELRRARFSAPALGAGRRRTPEKARCSSVESGDEAREEELFSLPPGLRGNLNLKAVRRPKSHASFRSSPAELSKEEAEQRDFFINKAAPKHEITYLKPPTSRFSPRELPFPRQNSEGARKSPSETETFGGADVFDEAHGEDDRTGDEAPEFRQKQVMRQNAKQSEEDHPEGERKGDGDTAAEAGVNSATNKRRRKIGIQHCVNEIAPVLNASLPVNGGTRLKCDRSSGENSSLAAVPSVEEDKTEVCTAAQSVEEDKTEVYTARGTNNGRAADKGLEMRRGSPMPPINTSNGRKTSFSRNGNPAPSRLGPVSEGVFGLHGHAHNADNTHSARSKSLTNHSRPSRNQASVFAGDAGSFLDDRTSIDGRGSRTQTPALENFRRLAYLSVASNRLSFGEKQTKVAGLERKLSRARLEEIQKPTESFSRQLVTKGRSISLSGVHPKLHELAPELRRSAPSGLRTLRKLSAASPTAFSANQRKISVTTPTSPGPPIAGEKSLSEMMADAKDCRYLRSSGSSSGTGSEAGRI